MDLLRAFLFILALVACAPAIAGVLYKSVDANGTLMFSDVPPAGNARILEMRVSAPRSPEPGAPIIGNGLNEATQMIDSDAALVQANARVDMAERALAVARRELWSPRDGLSLVSSRRDSLSEERVQLCKRDLLVARQALMELLRERRLARASS